jgi:PIN domain nuclease of toxin-antitoxin system
MRVLLDTHAFLWWVLDDRRLSARARDIMGDAANELLFSAASAWELVIKFKLGRLKEIRDFPQFLVGQLERNAISLLPVHLTHVLGMVDLPAHHKDPFDRLLLAQARVEDVPLLTNDRAMARYGVTRLW